MAPKKGRTFPSLKKIPLVPNLLRSGQMKAGVARDVLAGQICEDM